MTAAGFMPGDTAAKPAPATVEAVTAPTANAPRCNRTRLADVSPGRRRHKEEWGNAICSRSHKHVYMKVCDLHDLPFNQIFLAYI